MSLLGVTGERETGMDVRQGNVMAVQAISNIVKTSLGPQGLDKMLVDDMLRLCNELGLQKIKVRGDNVMFNCPYHFKTSRSRTSRCQSFNRTCPNPR